MSAIRRRQLFVLPLLALLALSVRLPGLGKGTITHPEFYTPGIEMPEYVSHPRPRVTLPQVIRSVFARSDIHPPGFYVVLWAWTKAFGTSHVTLRLPAALIGSLSVLLLAGLAARTDGWRTAGAAGAILALHGMHISKSIQSELWIWPSFYAVLSVLLLHRLLQKLSPPTAIAYVGVLALGLWTEYSFWIFAGAQIAFVAIRGAGQPRPPTLLRLQALAVTLALPVAIHLRQDMQHGNRSYLASSLLEPVLDLLRFGRLVDAKLAQELVGGGASATLLLWVVAAIGAGLLVLGLVSRCRESPPTLAQATLPPTAWLLAPALASVVLLAYYMLLSIGWKVPLVVALAAWVSSLAWGPTMTVVWPPLSRLLARLRNLPGIRAISGDVIAWHALVTAALLLAVGSLMNTLAARVMMILTPFLLIVAMRGLNRLATARWRPLAVTLVAGLAVLCIASTLDARGREKSNQAYREVAEELAERVAPGDLIVAHYAWYSAPLHYYLTPDRFDFIRLVDLPQRLEASPDVDRVWVIVYGDEGSPSVAERIAELEAALAGFRPTERFEARAVRTIAYERRTPLSTTQPDPPASSRGPE